MGISGKTPQILHYAATSCAGCDNELIAALAPHYNVERFDMAKNSNPKSADVLLVTGAINSESGRVLRTLYNQLPEPKVVVAIGACALSSGIFDEHDKSNSAANSVIPVDLYLPGCAAQADEIVEAVMKVLGILKKKAAVLKAKPAKA